MFGFGSFGQYALGEFEGAVTVQGVSGTGAAGILVGTVTAVTFSGVGTGVARALTPNVSLTSAQAVGTGLARAFSNLSLSITIGPAAGIGRAGSITPAPAAILSGVAGVGTAGQIGNVESVTLAGASGIGVARSVTPALAIALARVAGTGTAGILGRFDIAVTLPAAVGVGTTGGIDIDSVSKVMQGVSGIGVTNWVPQPFTPYEFVELLHFDAFPVRYQPDMTQVSVVLPSAVGGGVAGEIRLVISGGGTSGAAAGSKRKTGFDPVKKLPPAAPVVADRKPVPLPPYRSAPALVPETSPLDLVDRSLIPTDLLGLQDQIHTAQDIADIQRFLLTLEQDEQDVADIADVLSILDQELA